MQPEVTWTKLMTRSRGLEDGLWKQTRVATRSSHTIFESCSRCLVVGFGTSMSAPTTIRPFGKRTRLSADGSPGLGFFYVADNGDPLVNFAGHDSSLELCWHCILLHIFIQGQWARRWIITQGYACPRQLIKKREKNRGAASH